MLYNDFIIVKYSTSGFLGSIDNIPHFVLLSEILYFV